MKTPGQVAYEYWNECNERQTGRSKAWQDLRGVDRAMWHEIAARAINCLNPETCK